MKTPLYANSLAGGSCGGALICCQRNKYQTPEHADWRVLGRLRRWLYFLKLSQRRLILKLAAPRLSCRAPTCVKGKDFTALLPVATRRMGPPGVLAVDHPSFADGRPPAVSKQNPPLTRARLGAA